MSEDRIKQIMNMADAYADDKFGLDDHSRYVLEQEIRLTIQEAAIRPTRQELQKDGKHPAPCARFCESTSYEIEICNLKAQLAERHANNAIRFAGMVLEAYRNNGEPGDLDGGTLQEFAIQCGMIESREISEPCSERCTCLEYGGSDGFPTECLFNTRAGKDVIAASKLPPLSTNAGQH